MAEKTGSRSRSTTASAAGGGSRSAGSRKGTGKKAAAGGKAAVGGATKTRRPSSSGGGTRTAGRRKASSKSTGRGIAGLSLRSLVLATVAVALVVIGAAIGVSIDKSLRDQERAEEVSRIAADRAAAPPPPRPSVAPAVPKVTAPVATTQPPAPVEPPLTPPASTAAMPSPAASEAHDYADAASGAYREIPPERPPAAAAAPTVKAVPPTPAPETQVAALPTPPRAVFEPAPKAFDGEAPWVKYAVPSPPVKGRPMIAIVIDDLGVDKTRSSRIVTLPGPLTTAWMTYADNVAAQARAARAAGHELIIHMPMEPLNGSIDSGPDVLKTSMSADQVRRQVRAGLSRLDGYVGINNHMGSRFTTDAEGMRVVIDELRARGLLWLDSKTSPRSVGPKLAEQAGIPFAERHIFLDNVDTVPAVMAQLMETEKVARKVGYAIAIGHPHDSTFKALKQWLPTLEDKGLVLVPLSTIVRKRMGHG